MFVWMYLCCGCLCASTQWVCTAARDATRAQTHLSLPLCCAASKQFSPPLVCMFVYVFCVCECVCLAIADSSIAAGMEAPSFCLRLRSGFLSAPAHSLSLIRSSLFPLCSDALFRSLSLSVSPYHSSHSSLSLSIFHAHGKRVS